MTRPTAGLTLVERWEERVKVAPAGTAIAYFDGTIKVDELDELANGLAIALGERGVALGDRVGISLQNIPQFPIAMLALWKLGAVAVPINPMYKEAELTHILNDSGTVGLVCDAGQASDYQQIVHGLNRSCWLLPTSAREFQTRNDPRVFQDRSSDDPGIEDLAEVARQHRGQRPGIVGLQAEDPALLTYTSGTTAAPKGAINTHCNVLAVIDSYGDCVGLDETDVVFAIAPLFHITGAVINASIALLHGAPLVLAHRFRPEVALDAIREHRVTFTIGAITAFSALMDVEGAQPSDLSSVRVLYSGGAPLPRAKIARFQDTFGHYVHNVYGMTETGSAVIAVPPGTEAPVHEESGTVSVGLPLAGVRARIVDKEGAELPAGGQGELELAGPSITAGYWQRPEVNSQTFHEGWLRTGDGAVMDEAGWVYLVDRLKDQIIASGYKVWPREVEEMLCQHPAVREAAVVGKPDDYRGETVVAFVVLYDAVDSSREALIEFVRAHLAVYKAPQEIHVLASLPKTESGKVQRKALRETLIGDPPRG